MSAAKSSFFLKKAMVLHALERIQDEAQVPALSEWNAFHRERAETLARMRSKDDNEQEGTDYSWMDHADEHKRDRDRDR